MHGSKKQVRVTLSLSKGLLDEVDKARGTMGRSEFLRVAVVSHLGLDERMAAAPDRVGKGGRPTHKERKVYDLEKERGKVAESLPVYSLPYLGTVAAGDPFEAEAIEMAMVEKQYPRGCYVVRVSGDSMEPELSDGDLIVVNGKDAHTPGHGRVCVVSDRSGSSVKRWNRRRGVFESINEEFPDLEPGEEVVFRGYLVEKVVPRGEMMVADEIELGEGEKKDFIQ